MYGKHYESMYEGSMYGAGIAVFAVWGYVIAHVRKGSVELNPKKLSDTLGGEMKDIEKAIEFLMKPDPESRHKDFEGRRLLREGQFQYRVPSWESYQGIRNEDDRREYNKMKQREYRARKRGKGPGVRETHYVQTLQNEGEAAAEATLREEPGAYRAPVNGAPVAGG